MTLLPQALLLFEGLHCSLIKGFSPTTVQKNTHIVNIKNVAHWRITEHAIHWSKCHSDRFLQVALCHG